MAGGRGGRRRRHRARGGHGGANGLGGVRGGGGERGVRLALFLVGATARRRGGRGGARGRAAAGEERVLEFARVADDAREGGEAGAIEGEGEGPSAGVRARAEGKNVRKSARLRDHAPGVAVHADRLEQVVELAFTGEVVHGLHALRGEARVILAESEVAASRRAAGGGDVDGDDHSQRRRHITRGSAVVGTKRRRRGRAREGAPEERLHVDRPRIAGAARASVRAEPDRPPRLVV